MELPPAHKPTARHAGHPTPASAPLAQRSRSYLAVLVHALEEGDVGVALQVVPAAVESQEYVACTTLTTCRRPRAACHTLR